MYKAQIDRRLQELIPNLADSLYEAARYALFSPGKRLRPSLVLAVTTALGGDVTCAIDPACAIEMIHTYSLIHDDLPCMDDDDLRRGKPTLHKIFTEGMALLTGDYLLTYSFEVLAKSPSLSPEIKLQLIQILTHAAGSCGMVGGQAIDLSSVGLPIDEKELLQMHHGKTASLLIAALQFGAIISDAEPPILSLFEKMGANLGLAFQFLDDLLDATSTQETLGKKVGQDKAKGKPTAISFYGIEGTIRKIEELKSAIEQQLSHFPAELPEK